MAAASRSCFHAARHHDRDARLRRGVDGGRREPRATACPGRSAAYRPDVDRSGDRGRCRAGRRSGGMSLNPPRTRPLTRLRKESSSERRTCTGPSRTRSSEAPPPALVSPSRAVQVRDKPLPDGGVAQSVHRLMRERRPAQVHARRGPGPGGAGPAGRLALPPPLDRSAASGSAGPARHEAAEHPDGLGQRRPRRHSRVPPAESSSPGLGAPRTFGESSGCSARVRPVLGRPPTCVVRGAGCRA